MIIYVAKVELEENVGAPIDKKEVVNKLVNVVYENKPTYNAFVENTIKAVHEEFCNELTENYGDVKVELESSYVALLNMLEDVFAEETEGEEL